MLECILSYISFILIKRKGKVYLKTSLIVSFDNDTRKLSVKS